MIRNLIPIVFFLILFQSVAKADQETVVVQSVRISPYEEVIKGFKSICHGKTKRFVLSEIEEEKVVKKINEASPHLILAIGMDALSKVKRIKNIPIVYLMVLNPQSIISEEKNITGISMTISQKKQLGIVMRTLPDIKNVGLVFDPDRTGQFVKKAQETANKAGIKLAADEAHRPCDVPLFIREMQGKVDLFWMLPDITVITPETVEFLLLFSLENKIPILTFSKKYVDLGALMSIEIDPFDLGSQAGEIANTILSGAEPRNFKDIGPRNALITINMKISRKLGVNIDKRIIRKAKIID